MQSFRVLAAAALAALPALAFAQGAEPDVVAGVSVKITAPSAPDTIVFGRTMSRQGAETDAGKRTVVIQAVQARDGSAQLLVSMRFPAGNGVIVDSAFAAPQSLRALMHRSHQPTRTMRVNFANGIATGDVITQATGGAGGVSGASGAPSTGAEENADVRLIRQSLGGAIFDSNIIEFVVAALPLKDGFAADLPFYIYEKGGKVMMPVAVKERASVAFKAFGNRDAWVVTVGVPGAPATVWVDAATRAVLRVRYDIAANATSMIDERETRLPK